MDKTLIITMIASLFTGIFGGGNSTGGQPQNVRGTLTSNQQKASSVDLEYEQGLLRAVYTEVKDNSKISLHLNLSDKDTANQVYEARECDVLVNGGFYSKEGEPIGLFVTDGKTISSFQQNSLFNGILGVNKEGQAQITAKAGDYKEAVQTGPVLVKDGTYKELSIKNDEPERRMVAVITNENKLLFLSFYNPASYYMGPNLEDVPGLLKSFENETGIGVKDAINLDGGTASALYSEGISLTELRPVGSFFCAR